MSVNPTTGRLNTSPLVLVSSLSDRKRAMMDRLFWLTQYALEAYAEYRLLALLFDARQAYYHSEDSEITLELAQFVYQSAELALMVKGYDVEAGVREVMRRNRPKAVMVAPQEMLVVASRHMAHDPWSTIPEPEDDDPWL